MSEKIVSYSNLVTYNKELKKALGTSTSSDINYCYNQVAYYSQDNSTTNKVSAAASTTNIMGNLGVLCSNGAAKATESSYNSTANSIEYTVEREDKIINWKGHIKVSDTVEWVKIELPSQIINNVKYYCYPIYVGLTPNMNAYYKNDVTTVPYAYMQNNIVYIRNFVHNPEYDYTKSKSLSFDIRAVIKSTNVQ